MKILLIALSLLVCNCSQYEVCLKSVTVKDAKGKVFKKAVFCEYIVGDVVDGYTIIKD